MSSEFLCCQNLGIQTYVGTYFYRAYVRDIIPNS